LTHVAPGVDALEGSFVPGEGSAYGTVRRRVAFITGCGRSGTTILGTILSKHETVHYMNDQFELWTRPFPKTDIWGYSAGTPSASARVALGAADADSPHAVRRFREVLSNVKSEKPLLVEKVAINNFRIGFLMALVPEAHLINIVRNGVEVAYSIAAKADAGLWYGVNGKKWELLVEHAVLHGYGAALKHVRTHYDRGLLEWRMSVEWAERALAENPPPRLLRLRYEELIADAGGVVDRLTAFLVLPASEAMRRYAVEGVERKNPAATERAAPASTEAIAGETLRRLGYAW
jgi:hypothetical protein